MHPDFPAYTAKDVYSFSGGIGEFHVVGRDLPQQRASGATPDGLIVGNQANADETPGGSAAPLVSRDLRLSLVKPIKGTFPNCVEINVLGGRASGFRVDDPMYDKVINVGDNVVVIFGHYPDGRLNVAAVSEVGPDGTTSLPYPSKSGGPIIVDPNTWSG